MSFTTEPTELTETHSAGEESTGSVWGLRYEFLWTSLAGIAASLVLVALLAQYERATWLSLSLALVPAFLSVAFAIFRQSHPPGYDSDLLDLWVNGPGFGPKPPNDAQL